MSLRTERIAAVCIVIASFILFSVYSIATPLFEASDELWHYPMVHHLANGGGLPVQRKDQTDADAPWRQEGSQPPLYYWIAAAFSASFDSSNWREIRRINPHSDMGVPTRDGNANAILHTPAEAWPWSRAALAVRMARLVSILMSTATVAFSYLVGWELFASRLTLDASTNVKRQTSILRLAVPIFVACVPMFAFISGAINNDNAAVLFSTIGLWWALRLMRCSDLSIKSAIIAGVITGLGALSKSSTLGLIGLFGVAAVLSKTSNVKRQDISRLALDILRFGAVMLIVTLAISGWWFVRNVQLYGDLLGWNAFLDVVGRRDTPATLAQLWTEREGFVWAYWGVFGTLNVIMQPWIYTALNGMAVLALVGVVIGLALNVKRRGLTDDVLRLTLLCLFWLALVFVALLRWTSLTPASQGRLMFPCIAVIAAGMAYGLWRIHRVAVLIGCAAMITLAIATPFVFIATAYAQPANTWAQRLPIRVGAVFGESVRLGEAGASSKHIQPGNEITLNLNWQVLRDVPANYSVFVHLIDENDVIVAQRDMYPGQGNLALNEQPIERMWSDRYTLRISPLAPAPKQLRWAVGLYDYQTGERLQLADGSDRTIFGEVTLLPIGGRPELLKLRYANGIELLGYTVVPSGTRPGEAITITSRWRATQPIATDLNVSLQLLDEVANKVAQQDLGQPLRQWQPGQVIELTHSLQVNADAAPGVYRLLLVWYDPTSPTFVRTAAYDAHGQFVGDQIELTKIRIR